MGPVGSHLSCRIEGDILEEEPWLRVALSKGIEFLEFFAESKAYVVWMEDGIDGDGGSKILR